MSFGIALTGIDAAQTDLDVVSNNIANADTTGFKQSVAEFSGPVCQRPERRCRRQRRQRRRGVADRAELCAGLGGDHRQQPESCDQRPGLFSVSSGGALSYTRAGDFSTNADGYVVNPQGQVLQVYAPTANGGFNTSTTTGLQISTGDSAPVATQNVT
jgi:flagellar hook protein FlgE